MIFAIKDMISGSILEISIVFNSSKQTDKVATV